MSCSQCKNAEFGMDMYLKELRKCEQQLENALIREKHLKLRMDAIIEQLEKSEVEKDAMHKRLAGKIDNQLNITSVWINKWEETQTKLEKAEEVIRFAQDKLEDALDGMVNWELICEEIDDRCENYFKEKEGEL